MAVDQLNVQLNLDSEEFADGLKNAVKLIKKLGDSIDDTDDKIRRNRSVIRAWAKSVRGSITEFYSLSQLLSPIANTVGNLTTGFIRANAQFEKTTAVLSSLNGEVGLASSEMLKTTKAIESLNEMALNTPFSINAIQNAMVKLTAGGVTDLDYAISALTDSVAIFGGSTSELDRASIAIQQMSGKGVVSMEELRQQLGEAVPTAMQMMADGLGITMGKLANLVESGTLEARNALDAMFTQMTLSTNGAALDMMETWDGLVSRFQTQLALLAREMGGDEDEGLFAVMKEQLADIVDLMSSPAAKQWARDLGESLKSVVLVVRDLVENIDQIVPVLRAVASLWAGAFAGRRLKDIASLVAQFKVFIASLKATKAQITSLAAGMAVLRRSFASLLGPIGLVISIAYDVANAFDLFGDKIDEIREKAKDSASVLTGEEYTQLGDSVESTRNKIERLSRSLELQNAIIRSQGLGSAAGNRAQARVAELSEEIWRLRTELQEGEQALAKQAVLLGNDAAQKFSQDYRGLFQAVRREVVNNYNRSVEVLKAQRDANPMGLTKQEIQNQYKQQKSALDEAQAKLLADQQRNTAKQVFEQQRANIEKQKISDDAKKSQLTGLQQGYQAQLDVINEGERKNIDQILRLREQGIQTIEKGDDFWTKAYESSFVELAGWMAKLSNENVKYAKFLAKSNLATKQNASYTREQAEALGQQVQAIKRNIEVSKELASVDERIAREQTKLSSSQQMLEETNPWLKISSAQKTYIALVQQSQSRTREIASEFGLASDKAKRAAEQTQQFRDLLTQQEGLDLTAMTRTLKEQTDQLQRQVSTETQLKEVRKAEYKEQRGFINSLIEDVDQISVKTGIAKDQLIQTFEDYGKALDENFDAKNRSAVENLLASWQETTTQMDNMWANTMRGFSSALADFVMTGKLDFESLTQSILKNLLQITIQAAVSDIFAGASNWAVGLFGSGGVVGSATESSAAIQTYAKGGIARAGNAQVAVFGEGRQNEAFVPLPDGRAIPVNMNGTQQAPNVSVNVINQTNQDVTAEQQGMSFNGEQWVLDVVMKAMNRPGNFRTAMKGNTRQ